MRPNESFLGQPIRSLQTMLRVLAEQDDRYETLIPDGIYGKATLSAVARFQQNHGLNVTGITDQDTWDEIYDQYSGIETTTLRNTEDFPYTAAVAGQTLPRNRYSRTSVHTQFPGSNLSMGNQDPVRQEVVR